MNQRHDSHSDRQVQIVQELVEENASIDGDVLEISKDTWAIHGVFPYEGEVPIAVFDTYEEAREVLDEVCGTAPPPTEP